MNEFVDVMASQPIRAVTPELRAAVKRMVAHCATFQGSDLKRSLGQMINTLVPFAALLVAMYAAYINNAYWVSLLLTPLTAGFLVRIFIIQHDFILDNSRSVIKFSTYQITQ